MKEIWLRNENLIGVNVLYHGYDPCAYDEIWAKKAAIIKQPTKAFQPIKNTLTTTPYRLQSLPKWWSIHFNTSYGVLECEGNLSWQWSFCTAVMTHVLVMKSEQKIIVINRNSWASSRSKDQEQWNKQCMKKSERILEHINHQNDPSTCLFLKNFYRKLILAPRREMVSL